MKPKKAAVRPTPCPAGAGSALDDLEARRAQHAALVAEGYGAGVFHKDNGAPPVEDEAAALDTVKSIHATGGRNTTRREQVAMQAPRTAGDNTVPSGYSAVTIERFAELRRLHVDDLRNLRSGQGIIDSERVARLAAKLIADGYGPRDVIRVLAEITGIGARTLQKLRARDKWPDGTYR